MKRISFNPRFVNEAGDNLINGKIHTIRQNYDYWKKFEGQELALFTWEGKPYHSKQKVFCVKKLVGVQETEFHADMGDIWFTFKGVCRVSNRIILTNDGFANHKDFFMWFWEHKYNAGKMAILHFTDFQY